MKAKKILSSILSVLFFCFSSVALASCGEQPTEQPHIMNGMKIFVFD